MAGLFPQRNLPRAFALLCAATAMYFAPAHAVTLTDTALAAVSPNSASASYTTMDAPGTVLTVVEDGGATMTGSDLFDFEGLWLGSLGNSGTYTFEFNQPVNSISFSFIALSLDTFAESLTFSNAPTTVLYQGDPAFPSAWDGVVLTALDLDSRAVLSFADPAGFTKISFRHDQPEPLNGFVIRQLDFELAAAVPEPAVVLLMCAGLLGLCGRLRARRD